MTEAVLHFEQLLARAGGDEALAFEVLDDFATMAPGALTGLREAALGTVELRRLAHRFKGALLAIGAASGAALAKELELSAEDPALVASVLDRLESAVADVLRASDEARKAAGFEGAAA